MYEQYLWEFYMRMYVIRTPYIKNSENKSQKKPEKYKY